jgi:hypothetical protein
MHYTQEETKIATEIATKLNDLDSIALHLSFIRMYELWSLYKQLEKVLAMPDYKIRNNRAAYYNSLVQTNGVRKSARN